MVCKNQTWSSWKQFAWINKHVLKVMKSWRRGGGGGLDHMQLTNIDKYIKANVKLNKTLKILYASMSAITVLFFIHWQI